MDFGCLWLRGLIPEGGLSSVQQTLGIVLELIFHGNISITPVLIDPRTDPLRRSVPVCVSVDPFRQKLGQAAPGEEIPFPAFLYIRVRDTLHLVQLVPHGNKYR